MSFDPDAFLSRYGSQAPAFDPDEWLKANDPDKQSGLRDAANTLLRGAHEGWTGALEGVDRMVANVPELMGSAIEQYTRLRQSGIDADLPEAEKQRQLETIQRNTQQIRPEIAQSGAFGRAALGVMDAARADADKLQARRQKVNEALPVDADFQESTMGGVITGLGQIAAQIPLYLTGLGLPSSAAQMYDQGYQDAKQHGADEGTAAMAGIGNMPGAALEFAADKLQLGPVLDLVKAGKAPPTSLLTSLAEKMGMGGRLGKAATGIAGAAATEAGTEAVQQVQSNAVAQALYDQDRELTEGAGQAALIGGLTGGTVRGLAEGANAALASRQPAPAPAPGLDTGLNVPESIETLKAQQQQLIEGRRPAMMFPAKTQEALQLPEGFERLETPRGIFHFDPDQITAEQIQAASAAGKENEILGLGPVSKPEAMARAAQGDPLVSVTERAPDGTEVKGALATKATADQVRKALQADATPGNEIAVESPEDTILARIQARNDKKQAEARAAAEAEEKARLERQAELKAKQAQFESTLTAARSLAAAPDADYAALSGALNSLTSYAEDNSLGLRQDQRNEALAQIAKLAPRAEAAKAKFEEEAAQRTAQAKAQADAAVQAQKAKIAADQAAVKQQAAAGIGADGKLDYARLDEQDLERRAVDGDERAGKELMRRAELDQDPRESLLDALREVKLPTDDKGLGAELELVKEDMTPRQRLQLLRKGSMSLDQVAEALRGRGFTSIQTPDDVLTYTQRALRGENIRADRASQEQMGDVSYAAAMRSEPRTRGLTDEVLNRTIESVPIPTAEVERNPLRRFRGAHLANEETGRKISIVRNSVEKPEPLLSKPRRSQIAAQLPELVRTMRRVATEADNQARQGLSAVHRFVAAADTPEGVIPVRLTVHERDKTMFLHHFEVLERGTLRGAQTAGVQEKTVDRTTLTPKRTMSMREILPDVKREADGTYSAQFASALEAPRTKPQMSDVQIDRQWARLSTALGPIADEFDLRLGVVADVLQDEGYTTEAALLRAGKLGAIQAATAQRRPELRRLRGQRQFIVVATEEAQKGKAAGLLTHELAHPFFDSLPDETVELLREMHQVETADRTGPLYENGRKVTDIAITAEEFAPGRIQADPDLPVKEWFAERIRRLNETWLEGRAAAAEDPLLRRVWRQFLEQLQRIWSHVRGMAPDDDLFQDAFREWLASGTKANMATRAAAYAQRQRPQYAKQGVRFAAEDPKAELARLEREMESIRSGDNQAPADELEARGKELQARIDTLRSQTKQADKAQQMEDLVSASIKPASALRAPKVKPDPDEVIRQAARVQPLPKIDRKSALLQEWRDAKKLRDEGNRTGNETAFSEGQIRVNQMKARLDEEFPGWEAEAYPQKTSAGAGALEQRESILAQDDGRNVPPAPPSEADEAAPAPEDTPAPDRGRAADVYGHTSYTPTVAETIGSYVRKAIGGIRGPIPELPTFPAFAKKSDRFIREKGEQFYNRLKEFYRVLQSGNDYVQRTAQDQVDVITSGLLRAGGRFSAKDYKQLQERRTQVRKLKAEGLPIPAGVQAEISALQARLEDNPYVLFNRTVLFLDFDWRAKNLKDSVGNPIALPEDLNATEIANELARLGRKIQASPHKDAIARALDQHMNLVDSVAQDLKDRELLAAEHLNNPYYFPHLTLEVSQGDKVIQRELRPERVRVGTEADFRGYLVDPVGSKKPVETDYVRAMYYHLVQVGAHNLKADAVKNYAKTYDVRAEVEKTAKALSKQRGFPVSWEQAFHEEYAPQGYVMYGTDSRDAFPTVMVDRDKLARRLGTVLTSADLQEQLRELGLRGITLQPDDLKETLIQGQREVWIVPARVAEALRGIADRQTRSDRPIEAALKRLNGWWKAWKLFMPQNHLRYEYGNVVADIEKVFSASPKTWRYLPQAAKEVQEMFAGGPITADLRAAIKEGAINSITAQEMNQLSRLRAFEKFQTVAEKIRDGIKRRGSSVLYQPITNLAGLGDLSSVELSAFREGVTRYANFLANLEAIRNKARPDYAGAYWKDIEAIQESAPGAGDREIRQAAQISKSTFGDYSDISDTGQYLRDKLIPFYSWMEVNFKYHANLFRNLRDLVTDARMTKGEAAGAAARAAGALVAGTGAKVAGGVLLRLALPYVAVTMWNNSGGREELEDELSEEDRRRFHIIVGRDDEGKVMVIYANTAFADVTKWFSGPKFAQSMAGWIDGRTDFLTAVADWAGQIGPDLANNTLGSAGPLAKIATAATLKKSTFPDVLDPRTIPAYDLRRHIIGQATDDFTADLIERVVNKDYMPAKDLGDWAQQLILQVRQRDPEQWAYYAIKDKAADFEFAQIGSRDGAYDREAKDQQVLRNFRKAIYQGDLEAASKFYLRLLDYGYTAERFADSIRAQDPLSALAKKNHLRRDFIDQLDPIDTEMLRRAYAFYARMSGNRGMERRLFPSERTGEAGAAAYQANPRLDWVRKALQDAATMTEEDVQKRVDRDMRNSLQIRR